MDLSNVKWVKSSLSGDNGGDCVEVARLGNAPGLVAVRDSKDPGGPALLFPPTEWGTFIRRVKSDGLDLG